MKHCILVKFKKDFNYKNALDDIKSIFDSIDIDGVHDVTYKCNCIMRENRYDLLIMINMDKNVLSSYDECSAHHTWKDKYTKYIDKKAIFDFE